MKVSSLSIAPVLFVVYPRSTCHPGLASWSHFTQVSCCGATLGTVAGLGVACSSTCTAFAAAKGLGQGKSRDVDSKTVGFWELKKLLNSEHRKNKFWLLICSTLQTSGPTKLIHDSRCVPALSRKCCQCFCQFLSFPYAFHETIEGGRIMLTWRTLTGNIYFRKDSCSKQPTSYFRYLEVGETSYIPLRQK